MTNDFENNVGAETKTPRQEKTKRVSRRRMMLYGGAGLAGLAATTAAARVDANTQKPVAREQGSANPTGKFAGKVVLITGATSGIGEATARAFSLTAPPPLYPGWMQPLGWDAQVRQALVPQPVALTAEE